MGLLYWSQALRKISMLCFCVLRSSLVQLENNSLKGVIEVLVFPFLPSEPSEMSHV